MTVNDRDRDIRVSDAERERVVAQLREHHASGRLTLEEFTDRAGEAYSARTREELRRSLRELPEDAAARVTPPPPAVERLRESRSRHPEAWSRWAFVNGVCIAIWAMTGAGYFWPMWVLLGTTVVLVKRVSGSPERHRNRVERHRERQDRHRERHDRRHHHRHHDHGGVPPQPTPSTGTFTRVVTTVLYVDIVGSTERAAALGDARWRALLDDYESAARRCLVGESGELFLTKGDELIIGFSSPAAAVRCARGIREHARELGLEVRAGLHAGEIDRRGNEASGIAMHIGHRVSTHAQPGQVLVSSTVRDLLTGSGLQFDDAGEHELRGVPGTWHLYAVAD